MNTKRFVIAGVVMIVAAMLCNLNWAMNDYGIKEISLDSSILAQSTTADKGNNGQDNGDGGTAGDSDPKGVGIEKGPCSISGTVEANATIRVGIIPFKASADGEINILIDNAEILCLVSGNFRECEQMYCADFWRQAGVFLNGGGTSNNGGTSNGATTVAN